MLFNYNGIFNRKLFHIDDEGYIVNNINGNKYTVTLPEVVVKSLYKPHKQTMAEIYKKNGRIGGSPKETRKKYFDIDKEYTDSVRSISNRYGLNPNIVATRIAEEGPIDSGIDMYNVLYDSDDKANLNTLLSKRSGRYATDGVDYGLDDLFTHIKNGNVKITTTAPYTYARKEFINEKGRKTESITSPQWWFGIEGTAAEIKARRDNLKKTFPWMSDDMLDKASLMDFNYGTYGTKKYILKHKSIPDKFNPYINISK